ncbi:hypothetical protein BDN67DRAFT_150050 [Paxillus ammoniavirescens]|nr:hypothetical protein BDN67DRAFT_150050 [Paxillus ammoniavirescens]
MVRNETLQPSQAVGHRRLSIRDFIVTLRRIITDCSLQDLINLNSFTGSDLTLLDERAIWETLYRKATLPRPPGPYNWQSTAELSQALISSARVEVNWPQASNYPEIISRRYIPVDPHAVGLSVLFDRWIVFAVGSRLLWYDLHSNQVDEKILFDTGDGQPIQCLKTAGKILPHGRATAFAVVFVGHEMTIAEISFAAGQLSDFRPILRTQLPHWDAASQLTNVSLHHHLLIVAVAYGDSKLCQRYFVVDARTRYQYRFEKSAWDEVIPHAVDELLTNFFETKTHLIKARSVLVRRHGWRSFLECFPIPDVDHSADHVLSASHIGRVADISMQTAFVVHESPPDPQNGEIEFAVAGLAENIKRDVSVSSFSTATICLESDGGVSCLRTDIMAMPFASSLYLGSSSGHARGICGAEIDDEFKLMAFSLEYKPKTIKFSCSEDVEMKDEALSRKLIAFDAFRGTVYLDTQNELGRCVEIKNFAIEPNEELLVRTPAESEVFFRVYDEDT